MKRLIEKGTIHIKRYLKGQYEAYEIILTIMGKDFNLTDESKQDISV
jgi:hypothetical protein